MTNSLWGTDMVDISQFTIAKSDQLNADDLREDGRLGGPITVRIVRVTGTGDKEQPIAIHFENDGGRPYKPGKSMRRVLKAFWGKETDAYPGRWLTLYCDKSVEFGGLKVGGVRISHMSDVEELTTAIPATRGAKRAYNIKRLTPPQGQGGGQGQGKPTKTPAQRVAEYIDAINNPDVSGATLDQLREYQAEPRIAKWREGIKDNHPELFEQIVEAQSARAAQLAPAGDDDDDDVTTGGDLAASDTQSDDDDFPS